MRVFAGHRASTSRSSSSRTISTATCSSGWRTEVRSATWAGSESSKPTTATSSGPTRPPGGDRAHERLQHSHGQGVGDADEGRGLLAVEQRVRRAAAELHRVVAPRGEPRGRETALVHPVEPAAAPVLADVGALLPARPRRRAGGRGRRGGPRRGRTPARPSTSTQGCVGVGLLPRPAERDERAPAARAARRPAGCRGRCRSRRRRRRPLTAAARRSRRAGRCTSSAGEEQDVQPGSAAGLGERVQEAVHQAARAALDDRVDPEADQVRGAGAEVAGRSVG